MTRSHGLSSCAISATLVIGSALYACTAKAEVIASGAAQAVVLNQIGGTSGGGGDAGSLSNPQFVATTPDAIAASQSGGATFSCVVPRSSKAFSAAFIAITSAEFDLDRFCVAMTLTEANIGLAYAHGELAGASPAALDRLNKAGALVDQATAVFLAGADPWSSEPWAELWRP